MEGGKVYVVHNDCIQTAAKKDAKTYKIGITTDTVSNRYYGLGLKMPGKFVCDFAYEFDGGKHRKVENSLHDLLCNSNVGGEWFDLTATTKDFVRQACVFAGGREITEAVEEELEAEETDEDGLDEEETEEDGLEKGDGKVDRLDNPFLKDVLNRWNEVSDMKAKATGIRTVKVKVPGVGSGVSYDIGNYTTNSIRFTLTCREGKNWSPAVADLFREPFRYEDIVFNYGRRGSLVKGYWWVQQKCVPQSTGVDGVVKIMQALIEATKDTIISVWGKE